MGNTADAFHPELAAIARLLPRGMGKPWLVRLDRILRRWTPAPARIGAVAAHDVAVPGPDGAPPVRVRIYRAPDLPPGSPALLWFHGGGFLIGQPEHDDALCAAIALRAGVLVASVDYRLAPEHPFPAPLDDAYAALTWLARGPHDLDIDPTRLAIGGTSAGGGLAAQLALLARDRAELAIAFQALVYPMLDDRSATRSNPHAHMHRLWDQRSNHYAWTATLGHEPGGPDVSPLAAPARQQDLRGLPPAWVGVGTLDLFYEEDVGYAERLRDHGVPCALQVVPGAFHAFDRVVPRAGVARAFRAGLVAALRGGVRLEGGHIPGQ